MYRSLSLSRTIDLLNLYPAFNLIISPLLNPQSIPRIIPSFNHGALDSSAFSKSIFSSSGSITSPLNSGSFNLFINSQG